MMRDGYVAVKKKSSAPSLGPRTIAASLPILQQRVPGEGTRARIEFRQKDRPKLDEKGGEAV